MWAGKIPVPLNPLLKPTELDSIFRETDIDTVVVSNLTRSAVTGLGVRTVDIHDLVASPHAPQTDPPPAHGDDQAVLLYTSGTTGRPKGVPLTHKNLLSNAFSFLARCQFGADEATLAVLPAFHAIGLTCLVIAPLLIGAEVTFARFTPERIGALAAERKVTALVAVPSMYGLFVRSRVSREALRSVGYAVSGGDALPSGIRDGFWKRFGLPLLEAYGLTETSPVITVNTLQENKPGTVGRALPGVQVRICGDAEILCGAGQEGEVQVQGPNVMSGYFKRPEENQAAFTADGWFRTGDLGCLDGDGYLTITGRIKELIVRDGEKIMPREIEEVLQQHPKVLDAAVIGEPDGKRGELVAAFVVPAEPSVTAQELRDFCRTRLAEFKTPRKFVIAADLPRGPTGKIVKQALKELKQMTR
jgi:long-chain acyl-CoA synthetase